MATQVPFNIAAASDLVDLSIQDIWLKSPADRKEYWREIYFLDPVSDSIVKDSSITSIAAFSKISENGEIPANSPHQGFEKTYTQQYFGGMLRVTRPMWKYGVETRKLQSMVTELKNDANRFKDTVLANVFNNQASTSYTETAGSQSYTHTNTGGDGVAFRSTAHTREDGGTNWANQITDGTTTNQDFSYLGLKAAKRTAQLIRGGVGEVLDVDPNMVMVRKNSPNHHRAEEILNTIKKGDQPNTANREGPFNLSYTIHANPYFSADAPWGMIDTSMIGPKFGLQLKEGMPLSLQPQNVEYLTKEIQYTTDSDFEYGFNDARNIVLSSGANA